MELSSKQKSVKTAVYMLIIAAIALIQNTAGLTVEIAGARCFLLLPVCIILGMGEDEGLAAFLGLFGGLLWDLTSSVHLGFNAIYMCVVCFISAALVTFIIRNTFIANFVFSTLTVFFYAFLYWLIFIVIRDVNGAELSIIYFYLPSALYTAVLFPLLWICIYPIKKALNTPAKSA